MEQVNTEIKLDMNGQITLLLNRFFTVFAASFGLFLVFLTPNVNTGDAGELITASYFLGTAHPSGYPLYLLIVKAFSMLPFGNIGFKAALVSAFFSSLSLALLYCTSYLLTGSGIAAFTSTAFLLTSYSYLAQSVIAKFYTLNLFLISLIFSGWTIQFLSEKKNEYGVTLINVYRGSFFVFGLITANHNTGVMMLLPVCLAVFMLRKMIYISAGNSIKPLIFAPMALFFLGFSLNAYLMIRGGDSPPMNIFHVRSLTDFLNMITRQTYGEIGTLSKAGTLFSGPLSLWYGLRNFMSILAENFGTFSFLIFLPGVYYIYRRDGRLFVFVMSCLLIYGLLFTKIALPGPGISVIESYTYAHQYYLPALTWYAFLLGAGIFQVIIWFRMPEKQYLMKLFGVVIGALFLLLFFFRSNDSNYRTDHVPYQSMVDTYSIMPPNSYFIAFHDNERYAGRYLKLIGRYREDVCHINGLSLMKDPVGIKTCSTYSYASITPQIFESDIASMKALMTEGRLWAGSPGALAYPVLSHFHVIPISVSYLYLPSEWADVKIISNRDRIRKLISERLPVAANLVHTDVCLGLSVSDLLTNYYCEKYYRHIAQMTTYSLTPDYVPVPDEEMWK